MMMMMMMMSLRFSSRRGDTLHRWGNDKGTGPKTENFSEILPNFAI